MIGGWTAAVNPSMSNDTLSRRGMMTRIFIASSFNEKALQLVEALKTFKLLSPTTKKALNRVTFAKMVLLLI
jgi:hypothetical protein